MRSEWSHGLPLEAVNLLTAVGTGIGFLVIDKSYDANMRGALAAGVALLLASLALGFGAARRNRLGQSEAATRKTIRRILVLAARAFGHPNEHIRACVMKVSADGRRRVVDATTALNMQNDADIDWDIAVAAGLSGKAFAEGLPAFGDPQTMLAPTGPTWGLTPAEKAKMRPSLHGILVAPVFDPDDPDAAPLATVQVDTDRPYSQAGFDSPASVRIIQAFADSVAVILKAGE